MLYLLNRIFVYSKIYSSQDCLLWVLLPFATEEMKSDAAKLRGRFTGDPSFINEYTYTRKTGDGETMQEDSVKVKKEILMCREVIYFYAQIEMKEEDRLAAVVASIDQEVAVVPHGAYIKTPLGGIRKNRSFEGINILTLINMEVCSKGIITLVINIGTRAGVFIRAVLIIKMN